MNKKMQSRKGFFKTLGIVACGLALAGCLAAKD